MLSVRRQRTLCHANIASVITTSSITASSTRNVTTHAARRPATSILSKPCRRLSQSRGQSTSAAGKKQGEVFKYPEWLNVYRLGSTATLFAGFTRIATLVIFGLGSCVYAPAFYFSPDHSNWMVPVFIIGSAGPMVAVILATGPFVHSIRVNLPTPARRSREGLLHFANNVPPRTPIRMESMKLIPWPTKTDVFFADLTRHNVSFKRGLSNLEHTPIAVQGSVGEGSLYHPIFRRLFGRYYVRRDQEKDMSSAPGVWDKMWEQIRPDTPGLGTPQQRKPIARSSTPRTVLKPLPPAPRPKPQHKTMKSMP